MKNSINRADFLLFNIILGGGNAFLQLIVYLCRVNSAKLLTLGKTNQVLCSRLIAALSNEIRNNNLKTSRCTGNRLLTYGRF